MGSVEVIPISLPRQTARFVKTTIPIYEKAEKWMPPMIPFLQHAPSILKKNGVFLYFQYMVQLQNIEVMIRDDLEFGIEYHAFDEIPDNKYYRLNVMKLQRYMSGKRR